MISGAAVDFWTVTPWLMTALGNCELAWPCRICARIWSVFGSVCDIEVHRQLQRAVVGVEGIHVFHVVHAGHLLLDGHGHGLLDGEGIRAGVGGVHLDLRVGDVGELGDRAGGTSPPGP